MKVSELIEKLKEAMSEHGDLQVGYLNDDRMEYYSDVRVSVIHRKNKRWWFYDDSLGDTFISVGE